MKYTRFIIILCLGLFCANHTPAQYWQWARGNTGAGIDGWPIATDQAGNVFVAGISWGMPAASFGSLSTRFQ